jgi:hypothetical protein
VTQFGLKVLKRDQSIALSYGLDDRDSRVRFPSGAENLSLKHRVQNCSGVHPASYPMGTRGSFLGSKAAGAWSWPLNPSSARSKNQWSYTSIPQYAFMAWCSVKKKHRDNFTFTNKDWTILFFVAGQFGLGLLYLRIKSLQTEGQLFTRNRCKLFNNFIVRSTTYCYTTLIFEKLLLLLRWAGIAQLCLLPGSMTGLPSFYYNVQRGSRTYTASQSTGISDSLPRSTAHVAWRWPQRFRVQGAQLHSPLRFTVSCSIFEQKFQRF